MTVVLLSSLLALGLLLFVFVLARRKPSHLRASHPADSEFLPIFMVSSMDSEPANCHASDSGSAGCDGGGGGGGGD